MNTITSEELYRLYLQHPTVTTDSRQCPEGSIFIALRGASFDGNRYAEDALRKGCAWAVVDNPDYATADRTLLVPDCLLAFKQLAREHRRQFSIPVIGITGTNGKTTTKELLAAVLRQRYNVMATEGNFNNDVGVPKTLLRLNAGHDIAVVEMGASHPGDIRALVEYAEPTCGLITNVGRAHLQGFGSFDGVKRTKGELYDFLAAHDGLLFLHADDEDLSAMAADRDFSRVVSYGKGDDCDVWGEVTACRPQVEFRWCTAGQDWHTVQTQLIGSYNLPNLLAAVSVGLHFGVAPAQIDDALAAYRPTNSRSELEQTAHNSLIVDAYNANPSSMAAALDNFDLIEADHKMLILGDMRELGDASLEEHQRIADRLAQYPAADVWLVGEEFARTQSPFRKFRDVAEVKAAIAQNPPQGRCILIKGSNSTRLHELPALL